MLSQERIEYEGKVKVRKGKRMFKGLKRQNIPSKPLIEKREGK